MARPSCPAGTRPPPQCPTGYGSSTGILHGCGDDRQLGGAHQLPAPLLQSGEDMAGGPPPSPGPPSGRGALGAPWPGPSPPARGPPQSPRRPPPPARRPPPSRCPPPPP